VPQVSDLKPRPGDVTVGTPVPELNFNDADRKPWNFLGEFAVAPGEPADSGADFLVLLLVCEAAEAEPGKPPPETSILEDAAAGERAVRALKARLDHDRLVHTEKDPAPRAPKLVARTVLIVRKADGQTLAKVRTGAAQWGDGLLWSVSRANTIDRFMPGADAAIIVIKPDRTVAGIIPLGGRSASQEAIGAELERVVIAAAPETPRK
jgi:hypothetical protein